MKTQIQWDTNTVKYKYSEIQTQWNTNTVKYKYSEIQIQWNTNTVKYKLKIMLLTSMSEISRCGNNSFTDWTASLVVLLKLLQAITGAKSCDVGSCDDECSTLIATGFLTCRASIM